MARKKKLPELEELALRVGLRQMGKAGLRRLLEYGKKNRLLMTGPVVEDGKL